MCVTLRRHVFRMGLSVRQKVHFFLFLCAYTHIDIKSDYKFYTFICFTSICARIELKIFGFYTCAYRRKTYRHIAFFAQVENVWCHPPLSHFYVSTSHTTAAALSSLVAWILSHVFNPPPCGRDRSQFLCWLWRFWRGFWCFLWFWRNRRLFW